MKQCLGWVLALLVGCWPGSRAQAQVPDFHQLDPAAIPKEERFAGQPKELVAILGTNRGRHWGWLHSLAHSPDGKYVAAGCVDGNVRLWDAKTLAEVAVFRAHDAIYGPVAFSPDSRILATEGDYRAGEVKLWDVPSGKLRATLATAKP